MNRYRMVLALLSIVVSVATVGFFWRHFDGSAKEFPIVVDLNDDCAKPPGHRIRLRRDVKNNVFIGEWPNADGLALTWIDEQKKYNFKRYRDEKLVEDKLVGFEERVFARSCVLNN